MEEAVLRIWYVACAMQEKRYVCLPSLCKSAHNNDPFFEGRRDADSRSKTKLLLLETLLGMGADLIFRSCTASSESDGVSGGFVSILANSASSTVS